MTPHALIADDDEYMRALTQEMLEDCGYTVETAEDGLAAWHKFDSAPLRFDLLLLDKRMPKLDGIGLLKRLKSDGRYKELPVVMLTGDNRQEDLIEGLAEGAIYYLTKPCADDVLKLVIKNVLNEFRQKKELLALIGQQANHLNLLHKAEFCYRTLQEANELSLVLAEASPDPARTVNGYAELLINAVEHGNLGISYAEKSRLLCDDRWEDEIETRLSQSRYSARLVRVTLEKTATACIVTIADQGDGFNWQDYVEFSPERAFDLHGRGIAMSKAVSFDSLEYQGNGSSVVATVRLPAQNASSGVKKE